MLPTPVTLLERLRQPDATAAWERFVQLYAPVLQRWADHLTPNPAEADDLVQDVFVILVREMPGFVYQPGQSFRAWLKVVTRRAWLARQRRRRPGLADLTDEASHPTQPDPVADFWEAEYRTHLIRRMLQLLQADFEPTTVEAALASLRDGKSAAEVARQTGLTVTAVYAARSRVLRRLREELEGVLD